ncbi:MAG: hypothetical protein AAB955_01885 [Patescibacteria group bacterium]
MIEYESALSLFEDLRSGEFLSQLFDFDASSVDVSGSATQLADSSEIEKPFRTPGEDPVGTGSDPVKDAYTPDESGNTKIMQAADAVATADNMPPNERAAYMEAMQHPDDMRVTTVGDLKAEGKGMTRIVMSDGPNGGYNAGTYISELPDNTVVRVGTYTYFSPDGKTEYTETFYIIEECSNPAVDAAADVGTPVATEEVCDDKIIDRRVYPFDVARGPDQVAVVTRETDEPAFIDNNNDGDYYEKKRISGSINGAEEMRVDKDDVLLPGIDRDTVRADLAYLRETQDFEGKFLVYNVTDCEGNNVVVCVNVNDVEEGEGPLKWSLFHINMQPGDGKDIYLLTNQGLQAYIQMELTALKK